MIQKKAKSGLIVLLSILLVFSLWGVMVSTFTAEAAVDSGAPFYNNPFNPNCGTVTKNEDGSFTMTQSTGGGGTRVFYGDYTSGGSENPYYLDLTQGVEITMSVEKLGAGKNIELYFGAFKENGDVYPLQGYGQGFSVVLVDDAGANYGHSANSGYVPQLHTFSKDSGFSENRTGFGWLIYDNVSSRPSSLGQKFTVKITVENDNLTVSLTWVNGGESAVNATGAIPLTSLPTTGDTPFDLTKAYFGITNNDDTDVAWTIYDITDANGTAYYSQFGGKYKNSAAYTQKYVEAVNAFSTTETTAQQVKDYYGAKLNFAGLTNSGMRKNDAYELSVAQGLSTAGFDEAALAIKDQVFTGYTADGEITDTQDAIAVFAFYAEFSDQLTEYAEVADHIRETLGQEDMGQKDVEGQISALIAKYSGEAVKGENYKAAVAEYNAVVANYNKLSAFVRELVGNTEELNTWKNGTLQQMKGMFYSTGDSYFSNEYMGEEAIVQSLAGAVRNADGTTKLVLGDDTSLRLIYGTKYDAENVAQDYTVDLNDFEITFSIDSIPDGARFAINFANSRDALPYGDNQVNGITLMFRRNFFGNNVHIALTETKGGIYPTQSTTADQNDYPALNNDWGGLGNLVSSGEIGKNITLKFAALNGGVQMTASIEGGNSFTVNFSQTYLQYLFETDNAEEAVSDLVMNFTVGEGMYSFSGGQDIELTVKSIKDDYSRMVAELNTSFDNWSKLVDEYSAKAALTIQEIVNYNTEYADVTSNANALRTHEAAAFQAKFNAVSAENIGKIDRLAAKYVQDAVAAIGTVTIDNALDAETKLAAVESAWTKLSDAQKAIYADYDTVVEGLSADVVGCKNAKSVIDAIDTLVAKNMLPSNVDALRTEYAAVKASYDGLGAKYQAYVSNADQLSAYGARLESYDPAQLVEDAIDKLFVDYATITSSNRSEAKAAVQEIKNSYSELTDEQKAEVLNYDKIAEFEAKIAAFEQGLVDASKAAAFDKTVKTETDKYETITADNKADAEAAVTALTEAYNALTDAQKALSENYDLIAALQAKIETYDADVALQQQADAVISKINAIGTVANTADCKAKIDEARAAYDALSAEAKAKVSNLSVLEKAEQDYADLQKTPDEPKDPEESKGGCGGALGTIGGSAFAVVILAVALLVVMLKKKAK